MKRWSVLLFFLLVISLPVSGCNNAAQPGNKPADKRELFLATTTSTDDSGLLGFLIPYFEQENNITVRVIAVGTGQALELSKNGDADVVLVHAKSTELAMVEQGHFVDRFDVMYNDFVIVGPPADPAAIKKSNGLNEALTAIAAKNNIFVSRGDDSGTHKKELALWEEAGIIPQQSWYRSVGAGMGNTLRIADEMEGYTLSDRATYLSMRENLESVIVFEGDSQLLNQYGIMAVNPANYPGINYEGAKKFIEFMISDEGQQLIANFKPDGESLFFPNAR